jgi:hypothetical protein
VWRWQHARQSAKRLNFPIDPGNGRDLDHNLLLSH